MMIALQKALPEAEQFRQLMESMSGNTPADLPVYEAFCQCTEVIAAYDQERLVALGGVAKSCGYGEAAGFQFTVMPDYRGRDIEAYMKKLLAVQNV